MHLHVRYADYRYLRSFYDAIYSLVTMTDPSISQFEALAFGSTAMCGTRTFWFWVISAIPFYFATWEQLVNFITPLIHTLYFLLFCE